MGDRRPGRPSKPKVALLASLSSQGDVGGAERFFLGLAQALKDVGTDVEIVRVQNSENGFHNIEETYLRYYDLDLSGFDGVVSAKAPAYVVRHPNHVCYLMHTMRSFYDMFDVSFPTQTSELRRRRRLVQAWDRAALQPPRTKRILAIGQEVADRLTAYVGLAAEVLRPPTTLEGLSPGARFDYLLIPGRLHRWKRVDLAIRAALMATSKLPLVVTGTGEHEAEIRAVAGGDPRVRFLGRVSDETLAGLYAGALAVLFTPKREDLGLVTMEAFHCGKPVITCADSGEPARLVRDGWNGFVCAPAPAAIAARVDELASDHALAAELGSRGRMSIEGIGWGAVSSRLVEALGFAAE
jgi:glycosyltransferase involved in cell wall biosynthesis